MLAIWNLYNRTDSLLLLRVHLWCNKICRSSPLIKKTEQHTKTQAHTCLNTVSRYTADNHNFALFNYQMNSEQSWEVIDNEGLVWAGQVTCICEPEMNCWSKSHTNKDKVLWAQANSLHKMFRLGLGVVKIQQVCSNVLKNLQNLILLIWFEQFQGQIQYPSTPIREMPFSYFFISTHFF